MSYINKAVDLLTKFEGFTSRASWDVNAYRLGFGSDTITFSDGTYRKVVKGDTTNKENAKKDLARRIPQFVKRIKNQIGIETFDKLGDNTKAAVISIAYNYGNVPHKAIREALKRNKKDEIAKVWIDSTYNDNSKLGPNIQKGLRNRRQKEADYIKAGTDTPGITPFIIAGLVFLALNFAINPRLQRIFL